MNTQALLAEMVTLRTAVNVHKAKVVDAQEVLSGAMAAAAIPALRGLYTLDVEKDGWRYPSVEAARQIAETLRDDNGYYWACSRLMDLERILGVSVAQLPLRTADGFVPLFRGSVPEAHETVASFLRECA